MRSKFILPSPPACRTRHTNTRYSCLGDLSLSPTVFAEGPAQDSGQLGFWERLHATARLLPEWLHRLHPGGLYDYFLVLFEGLHCVPLPASTCMKISTKATPRLVWLIEVVMAHPVPPKPFKGLHCVPLPTSTCTTTSTKANPRFVWLIQVVMAHSVPLKPALPKGTNWNLCVLFCSCLCSC